MVKTKDKASKAKKKPEKKVTLKYKGRHASSNVTSGLTGRTKLDCPIALRTDPSFLGLPSELRSRIYDFVFDNSSLRVDWDDSLYTVTVAACCERHYPTSILRTCKFIRQEAIPAVIRNVHLDVRTETRRKAFGVILPMKDEWLAGIRKVAYNCTPHMRLNLSEFKNLKAFTLKHKIYNCFEGELATDEDGVMDLVRQKARSNDIWLYRNGVQGLQNGDGIKVRMTVWLLNKKHKSEMGWSVLVNVRD